MMNAPGSRSFSRLMAEEGRRGEQETEEVKKIEKIRGEAERGGEGGLILLKG